MVEALNHSAIHHGTKLEIIWVDAETVSKEESRAQAPEADGVLIPGGFGIRGIEGKIAAARFARENGVPYLGVCLGMQVAVVEFARHVVGWTAPTRASSTLRRHIRWSTCCRSRRRLRTWAAPCGWAPTR